MNKWEALKKVLVSGGDESAGFLKGLSADLSELGKGTGSEIMNIFKGSGKIGGDMFKKPAQAYGLSRTVGNNLPTTAGADAINKFADQAGISAKELLKLLGNNKKGALALGAGAGGLGYGGYKMAED